MVKIVIKGGKKVMRRAPRADDVPRLWCVCGIIYCSVSRAVCVRGHHQGKRALFEEESATEERERERVLRERSSSPRATRRWAERAPFGLQGDPLQPPTLYVYTYIFFCLVWPTLI